ncbi:MAG: hypothetical protein ACOYMF_15245 [Bacteroidales bacterium]
MPKEKNKPLEAEDETFAVDSENYIENVKYRKMLKIQRSVLDKLVSPDDIVHLVNADPDPANPETN